MFNQRLKQLSQVLEACQCTTKNESVDSNQALESFHEQLFKTKEQHGTVYIIGNGGSAGIASHFCIDLINVAQVAASTLFDSNMMTCFSNDYGYERVFEAPLRVLLKPIDMLVAVSSSGESINIINAAKVAMERDAFLVTLTGFHNQNPLRKLGDLNFWLDAKDYGLVEMGHLFLLHTIIDTWKPRLHLIAETMYARQD